MPVALDRAGWGTWIRTKTNRVRVCCATVTPFPNGFPNNFNGLERCSEAERKPRRKSAFLASRPSTCSLPGLASAVICECVTGFSTLVGTRARPTTPGHDFTSFPSSLIFHPSNSGLRSRGAKRPSFAQSFGLPLEGGRREHRMLAAPAAARALVESTRVSHYRHRRTCRRSLRNGFRLMCVLLCLQTLPECANGRF